MALTPQDAAVNKTAPREILAFRTDYAFCGAIHTFSQGCFYNIRQGLYSDYYPAHQMIF